MRVGSNKGRKGKSEFPGAPPGSRAWLACSANAQGRCTFWSALVQLGKELVVSFPRVLTLTMVFSGPLGLVNQWLVFHLASDLPVALITCCGGTKISHLVYNSAAFWTHPGALWDYWARRVSRKCGCSPLSDHLCLWVWGHCQKPTRQSFYRFLNRFWGRTPSSLWLCCIDRILRDEKLRNVENLPVPPSFIQTIGSRDEFAIFRLPGWTSNPSCRFGDLSLKEIR